MSQYTIERDAEGKATFIRFGEEQFGVELQGVFEVIAPALSGSLPRAVEYVCQTLNETRPGINIMPEEIPEIVTLLEGVQKERNPSDG